jgi:hypothetical protein
MDGARYPTPRRFLQEWQTKRLWLTWFVRVANAGLKVFGFSAICEGLVELAGKGVAGRQFKVESLKLK